MAPGPESRFWSNTISPLLNRNGSVAYRVENLLPPLGMPDVVQTWCMQTNWIELKVSDPWPAKPTTRLGGLSHYTDVQRTWARTWAQAGGRVWMLLLVPGREAVYDDDLIYTRPRTSDAILLFRGHEAAALLDTPEGTPQRLARVAVKLWRAKPPKQDLLHTLTFGW